jgi:hypothetical protein
VTGGRIDLKYPAGHAIVITEEMHIGDHAAVRSAKNLAAGGPFEVWRGLDCIYEPPKLRQGRYQNWPGTPQSVARDRLLAGSPWPAPTNAQRIGEE